MNSRIRALANQLKDEAEAIIQYTESLSWNELDNATKAILTEIRNDELGHAQKLLVALTEAMNDDEPVVAAQMDADETGTKDGDGNG